MKQRMVIPALVVTAMVGALGFAGCKARPAENTVLKATGEKIQVGKTTMEEVVKLLGEPVEKHEVAGEGSVYFYSRAVPATWSGKYSDEILLVTIDMQGVVKQVTYRPGRDLDANDPCPGCGMG